MTPVKSSAIAAIGYDPETQIMLVQMHSGSTPYEYHGVPAELHATFLASPSVGSFFHQHIKGRFQMPAPEDASNPAGDQ